MHEVQHRVQAAEDFASGTNPGYWNRGENYDRAAEKYRDNRARLLNGLSTEDLALYDEYRGAEREMGAMLDGSMLYDESRMDALEKRSDELYRELYGKEWFGKLNRYDRILGDAGEAVKEFYRNTAGEIEARDAAARRRMSAEERKNTPPKLGDADTVFADGSGASMAYVSNDAARFNPEGKTQDELLHDIMDSAEPLDRRYLYFGRFTDSFRTAMEKAGVEVKNLPVIMSYRDAYLAMESRENGRYQGQDINYHNLGIEGMKSAMENIGKPDAVMKSKRDGKIELFLDFVDYKGNRGLAIVQLDSNAQHAQEFIRANIVTSIYGKRRGDAYLEKAKSEGRLVYSKEEGPAQGMAQVQYESDINAKPSSTATIRQTEGNSQEKSSGKASVEVSGINNRTATELDGADTVFADGSISVLSEEARYEILKDRTIRPASVEYDKLGDTDTAAIYDDLSAAQMAQAKKAIRAIAKKLGLHQVDLKNSQIEFPFRFSNANAGVSAQHQSEYGGLYMTVAMTKIKESDVVKKLQAGESAAATSLLSDPNISIQDIFQSVKAGDGRFLKYAPDAFLNDEQKAAKRRAIQRQTEEYASYKIDGNGWASVEVENRNTETSEEDARRDFSPAGEPPRVHLAADSFCSITHALMPQKLRLRRNRSAFFCPRQRQTAFPSVQIPSRKAYTKKDSLPHRAGNPFWYARRDLNPRPLAPEANTLSS